MKGCQDPRCSPRGSHPEMLLQCLPGPPVPCRQVPGRLPGSSRVALFRQRRCQLAAGAAAEDLATAFGSCVDSGTLAPAPSPRGTNLVPAAFGLRQRQRSADSYCGASHSNAGQNAVLWTQVRLTSPGTRRNSLVHAALGFWGVRGRVPALRHHGTHSHHTPHTHSGKQPPVIQGLFSGGETEHTVAQRKQGCLAAG